MWTFTGFPSFVLACLHSLRASKTCTGLILLPSKQSHAGYTQCNQQHKGCETYIPSFSLLLFPHCKTTTHAGNIAGTAPPKYNNVLFQWNRTISQSAKLAGKQVFIRRVCGNVALFKISLDKYTHNYIYMYMYR